MLAGEEPDRFVHRIARSEKAGDMPPKVHLVKFAIHLMILESFLKTLCLTERHKHIHGTVEQEKGRRIGGYMADRRRLAIGFRHVLLLTAKELPDQFA